jgi:muramidase (phage lysozyme)
MSGIPSSRQNWLDLIAYAEGTDRDRTGGGYDVQFGGGRFNDLSRHPDQVIRTPRYASAAAGRYQFMPATWSEVSRKIGATDFGPAAQDAAAVQLMLEKGVNPDVDPITRENIAKLAPVWASLPTMQNVSYHGQPVVPFEDLQSFGLNDGVMYASNNQGGADQQSAKSSPAAPSEEQQILAYQLLRQAMANLTGSGDIDKKLANLVTSRSKTNLTIPKIEDDDPEIVYRDNPELLEKNKELVSYVRRLEDKYRDLKSEKEKTKAKIPDLMKIAWAAFAPGKAVI